MKWLCLVTLPLLTWSCSKKAPNQADPHLLAKICELEIQRHGTHPKVPVSEYGSIHMDRYSEMPGPEIALWQSFLQAENVCRGAYLQLYFDLHRNRLAKRWSQDQTHLTSQDRTRIMLLIRSRKATAFRNLVFESLQNDPSKEVRHEAGLTLGIFDLENDIEILRSIIQKEPEADVLSAVALSLKIEDGSHANSLLKEFGDVTDLSLAQAIITIVATADLEDKASYLKPLTHSANADIVAAANSALDSLKTKDKLNFVVQDIEPEKTEAKPIDETLQRSLIQALYEDQFARASELLNQGARLDVGTHPKEPILHLLASRGSAESIRWTVKQGADIEIRAYDGLTPFMRSASATARGWKMRLETFRDLGADIHAANGIGETALHIAARLGQTTIVKTLLEMGANPAIRDETGRTPLNMAMLMGHDSIIDLLKQKKASGK